MRKPSKELPVAGVRSEFDPIRKVLVHAPGSELFYASLYPRAQLGKNGSLDIVQAAQEHKYFRQSLRRAGAAVHRVTHYLKNDYETLLQLATCRLQYSGNDPDMNKQAKETALRGMNIDWLVNVVLHGMSVHWDGDGTDPEYCTKKPLPNLMFTRDQVITTDKGVVVGRMREPQRELETEIVKTVLKQIGITPIYQVKPEDNCGEKYGTLEGGDFFPLGTFALIGQGARTDFHAIRQLLDNNVFGFDAIYVVTDERKQQDEMHLDTYLGLPSSQWAVLLEDRMLGGDRRPLLRRFYRQGETYYEDKGEKHLHLDTLLLEKGFAITPLTKQQQNSFWPNLLVIQDGDVLLTAQNATQYKDMLAKGVDGPIGVNPDIADYSKWAQFQQPYKKLGAVSVNATIIRYGHVLDMYGGAHCTTQVLVRG